MNHQPPYSLLSPTPNQDINDNNAYPYIAPSTQEPDSIDIDKIKGTFQRTPSKQSSTPYQSPFSSYIIGAIKDNENKDINCFQTPSRKLFMDELPQSEQKPAYSDIINTTADANATNLNNLLTVESPNTNKTHRVKSISKKNSKRKICCSCQKSKCLKLYCDCFAYGLYCEGCNCVECLNKKECEEERKKAMVSIKDRNPLHNLNSDKTVEERPANKAYFKGCQCKKSNCRKKYCECYLAKKPCTSQCKCEGCLNCTGGEEITHKKLNTPNTSTPFTDCKSTCSTQKIKKRHATQFIPELYSSFTKKYSIQPQSSKKRLRNKS